MWSTGNFIKPLKVNGISPEGFTAAWAERTALYLTDIEALLPKTWKKIITASSKIVENKRALSSLKPVDPDIKASQRYQVVDADESD